MNRKQKAAVIRAIKADGVLCEGTLVNGKVPGCGHVGRCAMGAILFQGGMTNKELRKLPAGLDDVFDKTTPPTDDPWYSRNESSFRRQQARFSRFKRSKRGKLYFKARRILDKYGLTDDHVWCIIDQNDASRDDATPTLRDWQRRAQSMIDYIKLYL